MKKKRKKENDLWGGLVACNYERKGVRKKKKGKGGMSFIPYDDLTRTTNSPPTLIGLMTIYLSHLLDEKDWRLVVAVICGIIVVCGLFLLFNWSIKKIKYYFIEKMRKNGRRRRVGGGGGGRTRRRNGKPDEYEDDDDGWEE